MTIPQQGTVRRALRLLVTAPLVACVTGVQRPIDSAPQPPAAAARAASTTPRSPVSEPLRLEIHKRERELYVYERGERTRTYPIAIGQPGHPTPEGEFAIHQVDWNPDWTPPDSEWAEGESYTPPGHPDNPMGRVRMIYQRPYSIHGTEALQSLGRAASHGSVRMANDDIIVVARLVMEAAGVERPAEWYDEVDANADRMYEVELPRTVPLRIRS